MKLIEVSGNLCIFVILMLKFQTPFNLVNQTKGYLELQHQKYKKLLKVFFNLFFVFLFTLSHSGKKVLLTPLCNSRGHTRAKLPLHN